MRSEKCKMDEKFSEALLELKSTEIDFISDKLEQGYSKEDLLKNYDTRNRNREDGSHL